jgi:dipeptidyl aminopeptidase/acylaminoacyl peptidase
MTSSDVLTRPAPPPDLVVSYGPGVCQVADVRLPPAGERGRAAPLVLFLHGGFWRAAYDRAHTGPLATALAAEGFAVCAPEFRRTGGAGESGQTAGGWPATFDDIAAAVDRLPSLVREAAGGDRVSDGPPLLAGHSAGGHLALWAAARHNLSSAGMISAGGVTSPEVTWSAATPRIAGVVALAAVSDLAACYALRLGRGAAVALLGGGPEQYPQRYRATDPARLLPLGCPVRLVHGSHDDVVPCSMSVSFAARASAAGDDVTLTELPGAGHFDVIDPLSSVWPQVLGEFSALVLR